MDLAQLFAFADGFQPPELPLPIKLQPFIPDYVPAIGAPNSFTAPPRPDGEPDFLGLTVLDEPALQQSDAASLALQLKHQLRLQQPAVGGGSVAGSARAPSPPLGWVADPVRQPQRLDAWIEQVEALHQAGASAAALAPALPNIEELMQAWTPEMQAHLQSSPMPDPQQEGVDLTTFARMCLNVLDLQPPPVAAAGGGGAGAVRVLVPPLHALFSLYLEFKLNPAFQHRDVFSSSSSGSAAVGGCCAGEAEPAVVC